MIEVVSVKHGTKYGPEYVNRLGSMVRRNLTMEHRFHCITDDPTGVDAHILDIEDPHLPGWWQKLTVFKPDPWGLTDPILFLDLDLVILESLDPMVSHDHDFVIIKDFSYDCYNSSVFWLRPGTRSNVWTDFTLDVIERLPGDQNWLTECIPDARLWPPEWLVSYKKGIRRRFWTNKPPPSEARIVVFHGYPKPHEVNDRFVREHWR